MYPKRCRFCDRHSDECLGQSARRNGAVPRAKPEVQPQRCWNWFKPQHQQRDRGEPALLVALTKSIVSDYDADPSRVYVAGLSAGGAMADVLGHCYPDVFAAVGVHSGVPAGAATDVVSALAAMRSGPAGHQSSGPRPVAPTIVFHGDADKTVHERNGAAIVAAAHSKSTTGDTTSVAGQHATRTVYAESGKKSTAEYWQLHGVGHAWSGGSAQGSYTHPGGVDASAEMLRFFMQHRTEP
ncbi:extracellular catalytic domain type 1 short-chain-length polyhydroxyalkanoate depolymerase [Diaphorobacter aerolatus]|uniref:extracellular catalytic domain type 1 short-chain-length polyhydroxyalkanoate depolymerase n=1 Tax=Diaphorobacter aerolatus TaxID=1288495 RepID=UPI00384AC9C1